MVVALEAVAPACQVGDSLARRTRAGGTDTSAGAMRREGGPGPDCRGPGAWAASREQRLAGCAVEVRPEPRLCGVMVGRAWPGGSRL